MSFTSIEIADNPFLDHLLWVMNEVEQASTTANDPAELQRKRDLIRPFIQKPFALPGNPETDLYMVPVSGGADSSALAIVMSLIYPEIPFRYVFTDTLAETRDLYESMETIEEFLGIDIHRIIPENGGLYGLIESYGGFLPSMKARWCTRELKLKPYEEFIESIREEGRLVHSFVGIRADEPTREGLVSKYDFIKTYFPFQNMGIDRRAVFGILQKTVGVPRLYDHRTRSGCSICPFQRRSELLGLLRWNPEEFNTGVHYEKLTNRDLMRFDDTAIPMWQETGISANHQTLPFPSRIDCRTADEADETKWAEVPKLEDHGLFSDKEPMVDLWVGAEFFVNPGVGDHGVYWQELVTFSTTRGGLSRQMNAHYAHRIGSPEVKMLSKEDMEDELKLATYHLRIPARLIDLTAPDKDSYTWQKTFAFAQLKQIANQAVKTLHAEGMKQTIEDYQQHPEGTFEAEYAAGLKAGLAKASQDIGSVMAMDLFEPKVQPDMVVEEKVDQPPAQLLWDFTPEEKPEGLTLEIEEDVPRPYM